MPHPASVALHIYPDDCDVYGHVNQAAFLRLFERARWDALATGPGTDVFSSAGAWPAIRRASVEYYQPAFAGDIVEFSIALTHMGRSSFSLHQIARRKDNGALVSAGQFVAVCVDKEGKAVPVPTQVREFFGARPAVLPGNMRQYVIGGGVMTAEVQGDGEWIVFVHGFPFDRTMWRHQLAEIHGWGRFAPDLRGFGLSDPRTGTVSMADYADEIAALMEQAGIGRGVICGLSMGGYVALELWRRHPSRVRALVLANSRVEADSPEGKAQRDTAIASLRERGSAALVEAMTPKVLGAESLEQRPEVVAHVRSMIKETPPEGAIGALRALRDRADFTAMTGEMRLPVLVVGGSDDRIIPPESQRRLGERIAGAVVDIVRGAGHLAPLEQPAAFNSILKTFLASLPAG